MGRTKRYSDPIAMVPQRDPPMPPWARDQLDSEQPPEFEASYFDPHSGAWVLSRHVDILAALHESSLIPGRRDLANVSLESEESARLKMRQEVRDVLCPRNVRAWREELMADSENLCGQLPIAEPIDLIFAYGRPLCLRFAAMVTGITQEDADNLEQLAQVASASTADPEDPVLQAHAKDANRNLRRYFDTGPEPLRDSGFVGLSQTLLRITSAAWWALIQSPEQWHQLRSSPQSADQAFEELFRYASVIRTLWRTATQDVNLNGILIQTGHHVLLRVFAGDHDPERFDSPETLLFARRDRRHFAFGAGGHSCVAANLNRMAAVTMTLPLLARFASIQLARPVEWHGGAVMRSPASLWIVLGPG